MQTNKHRTTASSLSLLPALLVLVAAFLTPVAVCADNDPPAQAPAEQEAEEQAPAGAEADAAEKQQDTAEAEAEAVKEFKPSEQIGADSAVAFPIDI